MQLRGTLEANLRLLLHDRRMSVERLAEAAGVSDSYCWRILRLKQSVGLDVLEKLAGALSVPAARLLEDVPASTAMPPPLKRGRKKKEGS